MEFRQILAQLQRRGVTRVATLYSAAAWALLQVADVMFPIFGLGENAITLVLLLALAGFPLSVTLSWMFDLTPRGLEETPAEVLDPERLHLTPMRVGAVLVSVLLILLVGYLYMDRLSSDSLSLFGRDPVVAEEPMPAATAVNSDPTTIAVMPFVNFSDAPDMGYFGDGLAEEILNLLAKLGELNVSARTSSFYFKNKDVDIQTIARHLGVRHVLEGSVRHSGNRIRVTAQLIDAQDGFHLWSETYDHDLANVFKLQDEIATAVVSQLQVMLSTESMDLLERDLTVDPNAYDYYLRGRDYLRQPRAEQTLSNAQHMFEKAVEAAPEFADAFAGLCDTLLQQYIRDKRQNRFAAAEKACQRARSLDDRSSAVHVALGNLYRGSGQYALAEREFNRALSLKSTAVDAYVGLAETFMAEEKHTLAEQTLVRALELQPNNWSIAMAMGRYLFNVGRPEEAIAHYQRIDDLLPESKTAASSLGAAYFLTGRFEDAAAAWEDALRITPTFNVYANLGSSYFFAGRYDDAVLMYRKTLELAPEHYEMWGNLGDAYRYSDDQEQLAPAAYLKAIELAELHLKINPSDAVTIAALGHYHACIGNRDLSLDNMELASQLAQKDMFVYYFSATALCVLDEPERALDAISKALSLGYPAHMIEADIGLSRLKKLPDYKAVLTRQIQGSTKPVEGSKQ